MTGVQTCALPILKDNPGTGPRLLVSRACPVTDFQMRNYSFKPPTRTGEDRTRPEVVKRNEDHCDNVRYRVLWKTITNINEEDYQPWQMRPYAN